MQARYDDGSALTIDELVDEARTLIVGGHDTTTTALVWCFYYLHAHPGNARPTPRRARAARSRTDAGRARRAPYLNAVCNEALRLHPVVPIVPRMAVRPFRFRGFDVAPGQFIAVSTSLLQRSPTIFADPGAFVPDRFLARKYSPFEYAPFGGGARRCIGAAFGAYQMRMVLGSILARAELTLVPAPKPKRILAAITMGPNRPIRLRVRGTT